MCRLLADFTNLIGKDAERSISILCEESIEFAPHEVSWFHAMVIGVRHKNRPQCVHLFLSSHHLLVIFASEVVYVIRSPRIPLQVSLHCGDSCFLLFNVVSFVLINFIVRAVIECLLRLAGALKQG